MPRPYITPSVRAGLVAVSKGDTPHHVTLKALVTRGLVRTLKSGEPRLTTKGKKELKAG